MKRASFGIVFDIDGVLMKSDKAIPEAHGALNLLQDNPDFKLPFVFATNHGGTPEAKKAATLSEQFNLNIHVDQMLLSHTPMKGLLPRYQNKLVMVIGQTKELTDTIMIASGYTKWIFYKDWLNARPNILDLPLRGSEAQNSDPYFGEKVEAIFMMHEPHNWTEGLQVLCDVLLSDGVVTNHTFNRVEEQAVELFIANGDFSYSAAFGQPRLTMGAFTSCLETLYSHYTGKKLRKTVYGKPGTEYHQYAETMLNSFFPATEGDEPLKTIYMIGDNPKSDIQGANASGDHWFSILVRTGLFKGENDAEHPAKKVVDTVFDAILFILEREGIQH